MCLGLRLPDRTRCNRGGRILREGDVDTRTCRGPEHGGGVCARLWHLGGYSVPYRGTRRTQFRCTVGCHGRRLAHTVAERLYPRKYRVFGLPTDSEHRRFGCRAHVLPWRLARALHAEHRGEQTWSGVPYRRATAGGEHPGFFGGGRGVGETTMYFWEKAEVARIASLLEPVATRAWIVAAFAQPYTECHSFDTYAMLPVGNNYAANATSLFHVVSVYLGVTGDTSVLTETAGDRSVLDHLRGLAARARTGRANFGDHTLIDFGNDA